MRSGVADVAENIDASWRRIELVDADVRITQFCDSREAQTWFARLYDEIAWEQHRLRIFGRELDAPRLSCWIGDVDATYVYSRTRFEPNSWTPALSEIRDRLFATGAERYNSVLCNLYRDGRDSMGWHSDDEPELGLHPVITSLSFGAERRFRLRHRRQLDQRAELLLPSGSALRMAGATQANYRHDLPKMARCLVPRINLTFRTITPTSHRR